MDLHFMTIFLTNKTNWSSEKHIYDVFKIGEKSRNESSEFKLEKKIELIDSIKILKDKIKKDEKIMNANREYLGDWVSDSKDKIIFKNEHIINWEEAENKWLYYIHKIKGD